jgi:ABC-2 type transport system ATP-binding protein
MIDALAAVPTAAYVLLAVALAVDIVAIVDLARHDVRHVPKWVWAVVIVLVSFPIGVIVYFVVGRVPAGEAAAPPAARGPQVPAAPRAPEGRAGYDPTDLVISTRSLTKVYGDTVALSGVDLAVPRGATYGLIGPNGAGKTTMLSILVGLRRATSGDVGLAVPRRALGVLVDTPLFEPWLTAREVTDLARRLTAPELPPSRVDDVLAEVGLAEAADRRTGGFSRGMLQRLGLAGCLVGDPEVLVLDEPSSALDPAGRREVLDLVGRLAHTKTVVLSTHILADVQQVCDVVGVIDEGRLRFQGELTELLARTRTAYTIHVRPPAGGLAEALRAQPWAVDVAEQAPGRVRVVVSDAGEAEQAMPRLLAEAGLRLVAFNPATDLESAFLELVG